MKSSPVPSSCLFLHMYGNESFINSKKKATNDEEETFLNKIIFQIKDTHICYSFIIDKTLVNISTL